MTHSHEGDGYAAREGEGLACTKDLTTELKQCEGVGLA
jgi:hypothetical protein